SRGRALSGPLAGLWRYRVGDHRLICEIQDDVLVILVIDIGHRSKIYRRQ
ncbi:MAG: type II toxin-antitoxin system RelE/ParE family toxin, partial [Synergistaceae bacterium]|nr:type II toxin-antitoxin system RelE/ParE family toxin [Synergistaceae bacterium]